MMLNAAFIALAAAVLAGSMLALSHLREGAAPPPWTLGALHGLIGIGGLALLALALRAPQRGPDEGTGSFGTIAAMLFVLAALAGTGLLRARLRRTRPSGALIGAHATLAVSGFVILLVYVLG
jgi:hypothetical protein